MDAINLVDKPQIFALQYSFIGYFLILCTFEDKEQDFVAFQEILGVRVSGFLTKHLYILGGGKEGVRGGRSSRH